MSDVLPEDAGTNTRWTLANLFEGKACKAAVVSRAWRTGEDRPGEARDVSDTGSVWPIRDGGVVLESVERMRLDRAVV